MFQGYCSNSSYPRYLIGNHREPKHLIVKVHVYMVTTLSFTSILDKVSKFWATPVFGHTLSKVYVFILSVGISYTLQSYSLSWYSK